MPAWLARSILIFLFFTDKSMVSTFTRLSLSEKSA